MDMSHTCKPTIIIIINNSYQDTPYKMLLLGLKRGTWHVFGIAVDYYSKPLNLPSIMMVTDWTSRLTPRKSLHDISVPFMPVKASKDKELMISPSLSRILSVNLGSRIVDIVADTTTKLSNTFHECTVAATEHISVTLSLILNTDDSWLIPFLKICSWAKPAQIKHYT